MDRKAFLNTLLAPPFKNKAASDPVSQKVNVRQDETILNVQSGLAPYMGSWTENEVIHLLKRLQFGAPKEEVDFFKTLTYTQAIDLLLNTVNTNPGQPIKSYALDPVNTSSTDADWTIAQGKTWVNIQSGDGTANGGRQASCKGWWLDLMINQPRSIEEKMVLFWANHFSVEFDAVYYGTYIYKHLNTIRTHALGNFKALTKAITLEAAMLKYLNGEVNTRTAPDENYARELMELFTLGKGPGSQYTEADVQAAAKVLTGYRINNATSTYYFDTNNRHDTTNKTFSSFFGGTVITGRTGASGALELDDLLTMIFAQDEVAKYICRCLYRFFVYGNISADVETNVITPMANALRTQASPANNYDIKIALDLLFKSEHFFDVLQQGAMIKSPLDYVVGQVREFKLRFPPASNVIVYYKMLGYLISNAAIQDQNLGDPPNVSGWPAYYQDPIFDKSWLNTDTYTKRLNHNAAMIAGYTNTNQKIQLDLFNFARRMSNPSDPNQLVQDCITYLLRTPLSQTSRDRIKTATLLTGQATDSYWTTAWNSYIANPGNPTNLNDVKTRLTNLFTYIINVEEYQLM